MRLRSAILARFELGRVLITRSAEEALAPDDVWLALSRHARGDWGDLDAHDRRQNEQALRHGGRLFSAYRLGDGTRVWVITEGDRSATTVLLPEDY